MSKTDVVDVPRPGSVLVQVTVTGEYAGVPENVSISLYRCPDGLECTDGDTFDEQSWWTPNQARPAYQGHTGRRGEVRFAKVPAGMYILTCDNHPAPLPICIEVESGCSKVASVELDLDVAATVEQPCTPAQNRDPSCIVAGQPILARVTTNRFEEMYNNKQIMVTAGPEWEAVIGSPGVFTRKAPSGPASFPFTLGLAPVHRGPLPAAGAARAAAGPGGAAARAAGGAAGRIPNAWATISQQRPFVGNPVPATPITGNVTVSMSRTETEPTEDLALWTLIRNSTDALSFTNYLHFIDGVFCHKDALNTGSELERNRFGAKKAMLDTLRNKRFLPFVDAEAYRVLKAATEAFVMVNCGVIHDVFDDDENNRYLDRRDIPSGLNLKQLFGRYIERESGINMLPYLAVLRRKLPDIGIVQPKEPDEDLCFGIIQKKLSNPCMIELIWSYWQEEGMLVQSMNAITRRFQNVRGGAADPLSNLEIDPLRPLNNLIWGYTQDEQHRLSVMRRNYEYDHHYGVRLAGRAIREFRPADSRSKFLEAFHFLLRLCSSFFRQDDDTTVKADAFPVLNALKEVHLILSQGAHNQFGDLPSTARVEMMMQQWLLARPEFREFLPTRIMVAYPEPWMDRVDAMKKLQEWTDTSVMHFRNLAIFGEQLLLSIRYGNWSDIYEPTPAFNWTRFWRPQIQGYIHAYRAATGVDLAGEGRDPVAEGTLPSILLRQRLERQVRTTA
ncbi:MAG: hypothetical protein ABWY02_13115 [Telluria sp.]